MAKILPIAKIGEPVLRQTAEDVRDILSPEIQELIDDMILTMKKARGVGLAAPQVFRSLRIILKCSNFFDGFHALINPVIISFSKMTGIGTEGCLSVPGPEAKVKRYRSVTVRFQDREGNFREEKFIGFSARIIQHEMDHLVGRLISDF